MIRELDKSFEYYCLSLLCYDLLFCFFYPSIKIDPINLSPKMISQRRGLSSAVQWLGFIITIHLYEL